MTTSTWTRMGRVKRAAMLVAFAGLANCAERSPGEHTSTQGAALNPTANCTTNAQEGQAIIDGEGNSWTLQGGVVYENGQLAGYSANVTKLAYVNDVVSQQNSAGGWWSWSGGTWNVESDPTVSCPSESATCTTITQEGQTITDGDGNSWTVQGGVVDENGQPAGYSANVTKLAYVNHAVSQQNSAGGWWSWSGGTWNVESDPTVSCGGGGGGGVGGGGGAGRFTVANGQIIGPDGVPFVAKGIALPDQEAFTAVTNSAAQPLTSLFHGINIVRLACETMNNDPSFYASLVSQLTSNNIVVVIENHSTLGGGQGSNPTDSALTAELNWYAALASAFADNPYVWFGTSNEPPNTTGPSGTIESGACTTEQVAIYNAIRGTGNGTIVEMEEIGGGNPPWMGSNNANGLYPDSAYAPMRNIIWGPHFYNWVTQYSADVGANALQLQTMTGLSQQIQSADGVVPVVIFEYGVSTTGTTTDPGGTASVTAVQQSGLGQIAWSWGPYSVLNSLCDDNGNMTAWGNMTASFIASH